MAFIKDIERGTEDDSTQTLLNSNEGDDSRMARPQHLGLQTSDHASSSRPPLPEPMVPSINPSSAKANSTTNLNPGPVRVSWQQQRLNAKLLEAIETYDIEVVEGLLNAGANPNATCNLCFISACHTAAMTAANDLSLLIELGAKKLKFDRLGRTPLHMAAWADGAEQIAVLLGFPEDIIERVATGSIITETEKGVCPLIKEMINVRCNLGEVDEEVLQPEIECSHNNCPDIEESIPLFQPGWTPLHVASSCARMHCTRLLLAAGADPNIEDVEGRTPLDVAGSAYYYRLDIRDKCLVDVIRKLLEAGGKFNAMKSNDLNNIDTPLHTAVEIKSLEAIQLLLESGAVMTCLNRAGQTPLHVCVKQKLEEPLQEFARMVFLDNYLHVSQNFHHENANPLFIDVKDEEGRSVLQAAVEAAWFPGVHATLQAGADVTSKANDGKTPIHSAAALGNLKILNAILSFAKYTDAVDYRNNEGETALFKAIIHGHFSCVKQILNKGANLKITLPGDVNVLHVAAKQGHLEILRLLLDFDEAITEILINQLTVDDKIRMGPIHLAVQNNHVDCVKLLLSKRADIKLKTNSSQDIFLTPLHIAAIKNHVDIAKIILEFDKTTLNEVDNMGWFPLHAASFYGSRDTITILLREGADLSGYTPIPFRRTAIDMIINNLSKPTEFMEDVFASYISSNGKDLQDHNCEVTVNYKILMPTDRETEQMKVIKALLKTGNRYGQKKLLIHPLLESFLYLKWKALSPFFYTMTGLYAVFLLSLTILVGSTFFFRDTKEDTPVCLNLVILSYIVYATTALIVLQEIYLGKTSSNYLLHVETWVKLGSLVFTIIFLYMVVAVSSKYEEWLRHVATMALLLSWLEMMFLVSRFPNWGYYVLMFGKVASNVVKIFLTFIFLLIGFSLSFMIQFHSQTPFDGPWAAFVKTTVMMTSEFDYAALINQEHLKKIAVSFIIVRIIFLAFLILVAIVLMNLLVGVAVNEINNLKVLGSIERLVKQAEFLGTLEALVCNRIFKAILPKTVNESLKNKCTVVSMMTLKPEIPKWKDTISLPSSIKKAIFTKVSMQKKRIEDEIQELKTKLNEVHDVIMSSNKKKEDEKEEKIKTEESLCEIDLPEPWKKYQFEMDDDSSSTYTQPSFT